MTILEQIQDIRNQVERAEEEYGTIVYSKEWDKLIESVNDVQKFLINLRDNFKCNSRSCEIDQHVFDVLNSLPETIHE